MKYEKEKVKRREMAHGEGDNPDKIEQKGNGRGYEGRLESVVDTRLDVPLHLFVEAFVALLGGVPVEDLNRFCFVKAVEM